MRTLFTIHAGEFLVGDYVEKKYRNVNVWIPGGKDTGVDVLVSDKQNKSIVSLQVKFSRDFMVNRADFKKPPRACGWWKVNRQKLLNSKADCWVMVLLGFDRKTSDFVIMTPAELLRRLDSIHPEKQETVQTYLWTTQSQRCWETRGLRQQDLALITADKYENAERDFTKYLGNWEPIKKLNR